MPGFLLHQGATVACAHQGRAQPTATDPKVKVGGQAVATQANTYTVTGCTLPPPTAGNGPCVTAQWTSAATKVKAGGKPVLLANSQATCAPTGTPLQIQTTQTKVSGT
ncbi:MAG: PAAR-like protein [Egibacteraceae bacterium]